MSRAKKELPESLELLLDTMCNTFGGIMFIALALIIISQLVTKQLKEMTPEEIDRKRIEQLNASIKELETEVKKLRAENADKAVAKYNVSAEQKQLIVKIVTAIDDSLDLNSKVSAAGEKIKDERKKAAENRRQIAILEKQKQRKIKDNKETRARYSKVAAALEREIAELEKSLASSSPRNLRFAKEESTSLKVYRILLQAGTAYRLGNEASPVVGEVTVSKNGRIATLIPVRGTHIGADPEQTLNGIFDNIDKNRYFIMIISDLDSFSTLLAMRQYLRDRGFRATWTVNPEFKFYMVDEVNHKASF